MNVKEEYRYNHLTWSEMNEAIAMQKVVLLPTAAGRTRSACVRACDGPTGRRSRRTTSYSAA